MIFSVWKSIKGEECAAPAPLVLGEIGLLLNNCSTGEKKNSDSKTVTCFYLYIFLVFYFSLYVSVALYGHLFSPLILNGLKINSEHKDLGLQYLSFECKCVNVQGLLFFYV